MRAYCGGACVGLLTLAGLLALAQQPNVQSPGPLTDARKELALRHFAHARLMFAELQRSVSLGSGDAVEAQLGLADAELGLHQYAAAERDYRAVTFAQPQLWIAHKNLVIVEAAMGRWEEFDRERALLRVARDRGAPGIRRDEADVIDTFELPPGGGAREGGRMAAHWIVRAYYQPLGRTGAIYNFESFGKDGRIREYISLESVDAESATNSAADGKPVNIGVAPTAEDTGRGLNLNFYTGHAHGTIARYSSEPTYEQVRHDVRRWLLRLQKQQR